MEWKKRKDGEMREAQPRKEPTKSEILAGEISSNIVGSVFVQILALGFFFLALVALFNNSVTGFVILLIIGLLWEWLFVHLLLRIRKLKVQKAEEDAHPTIPVTFAEALYKNKGYTYEIACKLYCRQLEKDEKTLTAEDKKIIWGNSYDDFAYLLMWVLENNYYQPSAEMDEDDIRETRNFIARIKRHTKTPADFLEGSEGYFMEDEVKEKVRAFVKEYYENTYLDEVKAFAKEHLNAELYGFPFRWEDYEVFKSRIDEAYCEYQRGGSV